MKIMSFNQDLNLHPKNKIFKKYNNILDISMKRKFTVCYHEPSK